MTYVPTALKEEVSNNPIKTIESWKAMAWDRFNHNSYPALRDFYEGYGTALDDALRLLKTQLEAVVEEAADVTEVVKSSHKLRNVVIVGVAVGGYIVYKRRKEQKKGL